MVLQFEFDLLDLEGFYELESTKRSRFQLLRVGASGGLLHEGINPVFRIWYKSIVFRVKMVLMNFVVT